MQGPTCWCAPARGAPEVEGKASLGFRQWNLDRCKSFPTLFAPFVEGRPGASYGRRSMQATPGRWLRGFHGPSRPTAPA